MLFQGEGSHAGATDVLLGLNGDVFGVGGLASADEGLEVPELSAGLQRELSSHLPAFARAACGQGLEIDHDGDRNQGASQEWDDSEALERLSWDGLTPYGA